MNFEEAQHTAETIMDNARANGERVNVYRGEVDDGRLWGKSY